MRRLLWVVIMLLFIPAAASQEATYLTMRFDAAGDTVFGVQLRVIEETVFQADALFVGDPPQDAGFTWRISDAGGNVLLAGAAYPSFTNRVEFNPAAARLEIIKGDSIAHSQRLSFCDSDGECEPCGERGSDNACRLVENPLTCADCPSGGSDEYCDLFNDSVCDPDCDGLDADCPGCTAETCYYRDSGLVRTLCVEDIKGEICEPLAGCTGRFVYADDSGSRCCVDGVCEHALSLPPSCSKLGGVMCWAADQCTGTMVSMHHSGYACCVGGECAAEVQVGEGGIELPLIPEDVLESKMFIAMLILLEALLLILIVVMLKKRRKRK